MAYKVELSRAAQKSLRQITREAQSRIIEALEGLATNPRPDGCKKLKGSLAGRWRVRVGKLYRIIYTVDDGRLTVLVIDIPDRDDAY